MTSEQESKLLARITSDPEKCGGQPCIRGMRIRVIEVLDMLADNVPGTRASWHDLLRELQLS